jgi:hypothetical protein
MRYEKVYEWCPMKDLGGIGYGVFQFTILHLPEGPRETIKIHVQDVRCLV